MRPLSAPRAINEKAKSYFGGPGIIALVGIAAVVLVPQLVIDKTTSTTYFATVAAMAAAIVVVLKRGRDKGAVATASLIVAGVVALAVAVFTDHTEVGLGILGVGLAVAVGVLASQSDSTPRRD